jgi:transcriptional regulator with XRE-family HTH domain
VDPLIGQLLHLRTRRNLAPFELNQEAGLARGSVQQIEAGSRVPKLSTLRALADLFDCDLVLVARDGAR